MGLHLESGRYVFHCDLCPAEFETDTAVLIDAGASAATEGWNCHGNEWYCPKCLLSNFGIQQR